MKAIYLFSAVTAIVGIAVAGEIEVVATEVSSFTVTADLRVNHIRTLADISELQPLAQNSDSEWRIGGDPEISTFVRVLKASTAEDPETVASWVVDSSSELNPLCGEGTMTWLPKKASLYKLELVCGGTVVKESYFNMLGTQGLEDKTSIEDAEVSLPYGTAEYTGHAIEPIGLTVVLDGKNLKEGSDYFLVYDNNREIGEATVSVLGANDYKGVVSKTFEIVPGSLVSLTDAAYSGVTLDGRMNEVLSVVGHGQLLPITWNTSEKCVVEERSVWVIGGLPEEENALATVAVAKIDNPEAEPDKESWQEMKVAAGEGLVKWKDVKNGLYKFRLTVTIDGRAVEGALTRVIRVRGCNGLVLFIQ